MSSSNKQKAIKGISSQAIVTIAIGLLEILVFSVMSRLLSKEDFGLFASVSAITMIINSISEAGIGSAIIQKKNISDNYINTAFTLSFILGCFFSLLLFSFAGRISEFILDDTIVYPMRLMSITVFCNSMTSVAFALMRRNLLFLQSGLINFISHLISAIIAIYLAYVGYGVYAIVFKAVCNSLLVTIISYFLVNRRFRFTINTQYTASIINFGGWLTLSVLLRNIASQVDKLLMSRYLSVASLGAYNRPREFINVISIRLNGIFDTALFPILSSIQDAESRMQNAFHSALYYMNMFSMLLAISFISNGSLIIRIFFGQSWLELLSVFSVLSISLLFNIDGRLCDCFFRSIGLVKIQFHIRLFEFFMTIGCLMIGFKWDIIGVAVAVMTSSFSIIILKLCVITRSVKSNMSSILRIILSSWRYALLVLPYVYIVKIITPNNLLGEITFLLAYVIFCALIFLFVPSLVGKKYQEELHPVIINKLKLHKK